jgi:NAD(P)H-hydrate epimerase
MLLVTADQMREMDRRTIEEVGIPGIVLMERAALGAVDALLAHFEPHISARIGILCGGGNNGGDGFAMARLLSELGFGVWVGAMRAPSQYSDDAAQNCEILDELGIHVLDLSDVGEDDLVDLLDTVPGCEIWVDALFGTGLDRDVEGAYASAIEFLRTRPRVFAVDIPSGIHADSGQVMGVAVRASATATFGHPKLGQALYPGREHCGELFPVDIGIPASVTRDVGWEAEYLVGDRWVPRRNATMHKGDAGRVLLIGGEVGKTGAILMATRAALCSGAGLAIVGTYDENVPLVAPAVQEAMASAVLATTMERSHADNLDDLLEWADVVALGPGMGTHDGAFEVLELALEEEKALVIDADGLTLLADHRMQLNDIESAPLVLTPHPGEAARLCGCSVADILEDPVGRAMEISDDWDAIVVLKGAGTVVAQHDPHRLAVNSSGNPGMATGGMGDALTGMVAAQLCERLPAFDAVCNAVWAHGEAADRKSRAVGHRGLTVSALLEELPTVWRDMEEA